MQASKLTTSHPILTRQGVCRSVLAIVGPAHAGKSALVCALGNQIYKPAKMYGEILINGLPPKQSPVQPTFFDGADEPLMNITVELALLYTGGELPAAARPATAALAVQCGAEPGGPLHHRLQLCSQTCTTS